MANQVDFKILPSDQFNVYSPQTRSDKIITYFTLLSKLRGDILAVSQQDDPNDIVSAYYTNVGGTQTLHLVKADGSEVTASQSEQVISGTLNYVSKFTSSNDIGNSQIFDDGTNVGIGTTTMTHKLQLGSGGVFADYYQLDTTYSNGFVVGAISWDSDNGTADLGLSGSLKLKIGQDDMWYVKNQTGSPITKGTAVYASGALGASGRILVSPMIANGTIPARFFLGIVAETIANGSEGYVMNKGKIRQINTNAYNEGDVLWVSPTTAGALTATEPTAPNLKLAVAFVVHKNTNGVIAVRATTGTRIEDASDVNYTGAVDNSFLVYNSSTGVWEDESVGIFKTIAVSGQSSVVADTYDDTLTLVAGTNVTITTNASTDTITINSTDQYVGTVTSVDMSVPTGFTISGNPITTSGTLALAFASGYSLPTNASQTNWTAAYNDKINSASFNTSTGVITLTQQDTGTVTVDIDGRFILLSEKAAANGVATLDSGGKIPTSQLPSSVFEYKGTWNAATNTPTLANGTGDAGDVYRCTVAGTVNFGAGPISFEIGDLVIYDGTDWQKSDSTDAVTSVNGLTGTVVLTTTNIAEGTNLYFTTARARQSLSAGTGISYNNSTGVITNSAPDQTVALTGAGTTVVTGTYPNFTITSNDQYVGTVTSVGLTAGTGISVSGGPITTSGSITVTNNDRGSSQNIFKNIDVAGQSTIVADNNNDTLTVAAGVGISLTTNATTDTLTITNSAPDQTVVLTGAGTTVITGTYPNFTITSNDQYAGTVTSVNMSVPTGFAISGNPVTTSGTLALAFAAGYSLPTNTSQTNWNTAYNDSITAFAYNTSTGVLTLTQQDAGTLTATVTLQPFTTDNLTQGSTNLYDKIVSLTGAGTTVVTGTYPNFTITSNDQHVGTVTSIATSAPITGGTITTTGTIGITQSGASTDGYLSSTDWNTFNSKEPALTKGNLTEATSAVLTITGGTGAVIGSGTTIQVAQASSTTSGYLSSTDWTTFNNKQSALTFTSPLVNTSGTVTINQSGASADGYLSSTDWNTFNGKASNSFTTIAVATQTSIVADSATDTLTIAAGSGVSITTNALTDTLTISATGTGGTVTSVDLTAGGRIDVSGGPITTSGSITVAHGTSTGADVTTAQSFRLRVIADGGTFEAFNDVAIAIGSLEDIATPQDTDNSGGTVLQNLVLDEYGHLLGVGSKTLTTTDITEGTNLYYTDARARLALSAGTGISYDNVTGIITNSAPDQTVVLTGTGTTTITGTYPSFTINSDDQYDGTVTSVDLTAGTGISVSGGPITTSGSITVTNTAPDQTVVLTAGTGISTSGTYPNFTITNSAPDQTVVLTAGTGISTSGTYPNFTITNSAPDQTVALTAGTGISVSGTYPNFTITNSSPSSGGTVTSIATTAPITGGTITSTGTIGITQSSASADGYLSSTDWSTFNGKQNAITLTTTGNSGAATFVTNTLNIPNYTLSGLGGVPTSRTLTINGTAYDLTANRSWSVGTVTSIDLTAGDRIEVSGGPITSSGSITVTHGTASGADFTTAQDFEARVLADGGIFEALGEVAIAIGSLEDAASASSTDYNDGFVLQNIAVDTYGHVLGVGATDLDDRYVQNLTAGTGITVSGSPSSTAGLITVTNSDRGSSQNIFKNVAVSGQPTIVADNNDDTLTIAAGTGISLTTNATTDTVTIATTVSPISVFSAYSSTGVTLSTSGSSYDLNLNTETIVDTSIYSHSTSINPEEVTVLSGGVYEITYSGTLLNSNGSSTAAAVVDVDIYKNGSIFTDPLNTTQNVSHLNVSNYNYLNQISNSYIVNLDDNDVIKLVLTVNYQGGGSPSPAVVFGYAGSAKNNLTIKKIG